MINDRTRIRPAHEEVKVSSRSLFCNVSTHPPSGCLINLTLRALDGCSRAGFDIDRLKRSVIRAASILLQAQQVTRIRGPVQHGVAKNPHPCQRFCVQQNRTALFTFFQNGEPLAVGRPSCHKQLVTERFGRDMHNINQLQATTMGSNRSVTVRRQAKAHPGVLVSLRQYDSGSDFPIRKAKFNKAIEIRKENSAPVSGTSPAMTAKPSRARYGRGASRLEFNLA